ncbi:MAG: hypothetical protein ABFS14_05590 [Gemmatimonadota bacterium]
MKLSREIVIATLSASLAALAILARHPEPRKVEPASVTQADVESERWFI